MKNRESSLSVTDWAEGLKASEENPSTLDMEKKKSSRLSAMERKQAETNRRLEEVVKSNVNLHGLLEIVISRLSGSENDRHHTSKGDGKSISGQTPISGTPSKMKSSKNFGGPGCDEKPWDGISHSSADDMYADDVDFLNVQSSYDIKNEVQLCHPIQFMSTCIYVLFHAI
ncbi:hypothetical protein M758_UG087300 [Ceratodon purpureus]|nr:hypothetical protein M758_UG087300 [Ceratodon purpureus]KAG0594545.1 hypothetical protein M758_UG087300 [Ceratodon purpureus]KAG0594546.1 hypothetical protein M758_UG087300 [Ceratodon purpureus]KAG0594547.1 hypothetical protein M758_UG087300 [Ceratodon purpureus]KAG0594548.1 hypothetical protein M758_UG087300 [Ceratodon purpureus]